MKIWIVSFVMFALMIGSAFAVPGIPHNFYGSVTINGNPAPDGTSVSVKIDGAQVTNTITTSGKFGYTPNIFYVEDPNNDRSGKTIYFYVNGVDTGKTAIFANGASTQVDLAITVTVPEPPPSGGGGGSSSGGGGGGFVTPKPKNTTNTTNVTNTTGLNQGSSGSGSSVSNNNTNTTSCTERWLCTDWSSCKNNTQARTCEDVNKCGSDLYKPMESQPCSLVQEDAAKQAPPLTAFAVASPEMLGGVAVLVIIIIAVVGWQLMKRNKKAPTVTSSGTEVGKGKPKK